MYINKLVSVVTLIILLPHDHFDFIAFVNGGGNSPPPSAHYYYSIGDAAINCGSVSNSTALDGREWSEEEAVSKFLSGNSRSSTAAEKLSFSIDPVPYKTSRISSTEFGYTFEVNPGQKFIRLHFYPASYRGFENSIDFFTVKAGPFTLLANFSASLAAQTLGVNYLVKEFCLNVEERTRLNINFLPSLIPNSNLKAYAFVNGIEIISMPTGLYYTPDGDLGARVVGQKNQFHRIVNTTALELTNRLNIGGSFISSVEDFGMFRRWSEDTKYLLESGVHRINHQVHRIKYAAFIAPPKLYQTSWKKTGGNIRVNQMHNFTWKIPIKLGFGYLVRLHFCELDDGMAESEQREFNVLINNHIVETRADVIRWSGGNGIPVFRDYMLAMEGDKGRNNSDLLIALQSVNHLVFGLLNGVEIFKLSNLENSLATPNPAFPKRLSASWNMRIQKVFLGFGQSNVIMAGMTILITLVTVVLYNLRLVWEKKFPMEKDTQAAKTEPSYHCFSLAEIKSATQNFSETFVIGRGGFGKVYKGFIRSISGDAAIKRLSIYSKQGAREFWTEIETLSKLRHVHLVSLLGYCNEGQEMILVYEYMPCGTLADHLYKLSRKGKDIAPLSWEQRLKICIGAARGMEYLHTGTECTVIHRDVKDSNILLDKNFVAKISDFGLSKLEKIVQSKSYVSTKIKGTAGYWDPEYVTTGRLTRKSDVYSFGVVLLVVLAGRPVKDTRNEEEPQSLLSHFQECITEGDVDRIVDPSLQGKISANSLLEFFKSVENCLHHLPKKRPTMAQVVASLEQALEQQESHMISAPINATLVVKEEVQILGENVIPSPEEGITRESTDNSYSPTIGNDIQSRRTGYARVPRSSWNWPWKAFWNRCMKDGLRKMDIEILPEKPVQSGKDQLGVGFTAIGAKVKGEGNVFRKKSLMFFGNVGRGFDLNKLLHAPAKILGHGMLGTAYMAMLEPGITVAVKRLRDVSHVTASEKEFRKKMEEIGKMDHANLMPLLAYYYSRDKKLLVHDYLPMGSLSALLHGQSGFETPLNWETRATIALGAARGITFLHSQGPSVSHGNIKSSNVLLTSTYKARISDFGIAHLASPHPTPYHFSGYWAPEITHPLTISQKADVYSFGVLLLELLTGKSPTHSIMNDKEVHLPSWVRFLLREERTEEVFDVKLSRYQNIEEDMVQLLQLALNCTAQCPDGRPSMTEVTNRIEKLYGSTSQDPT